MGIKKKHQASSSHETVKEYRFVFNELKSISERLDNLATDFKELDSNVGFLHEEKPFQPLNASFHQREKVISHAHKINQEKVERAKKTENILINGIAGSNSCEHMKVIDNKEKKNISDFKPKYYKGDFYTNSSTEQRPCPCQLYGCVNNETFLKPTMNDERFGYERIVQSKITKCSHDYHERKEIPKNMREHAFRSPKPLRWASNLSHDVPFNDIKSTAGNLYETFGFCELDTSRNLKFEMINSNGRSYFKEDEEAYIVDCKDFKLIVLPKNKRD